jgi:hypothetical protein
VVMTNQLTIQQLKLFTSLEELRAAVADLDSRVRRPGRSKDLFELGFIETEITFVAHLKLSDDELHTATVKIDPFKNVVTYDPPIVMCDKTDGVPRYDRY